MKVKIVVTIGGKEIKYDNLVINKSLNSFLSICSLDVIGGNPKTGEHIFVFKGSDEVFEGFINVVQFSLLNKTTAVTARDTLQDVVDCTVSEPYIFRKVNTLQVIKRLLLPFGLSCGSNFNFKTLDIISVVPGEKVIEAIKRLAALEGLLVQNVNNKVTLYAPDSNPFVSTPNTIKEVQGEILEISTRADDSNLHSLFTVVSSVKSSGWEQEVVETNEIAGTSNRYRPLTIIAQNPLTKEESKSKVRWTRDTREADYYSLNLVKQDWDDFKLGVYVKINTSVSEVSGVEFLIKSVQLSNSGASGLTNSIELINKNAYLKKEVTGKKRVIDSGGWGDDPGTKSDQKKNSFTVTKGNG